MKATASAILHCGQCNIYILHCVFSISSNCVNTFLRQLFFKKNLKKCIVQFAEQQYFQHTNCSVILVFNMINTVGAYVGEIMRAVHDSEAISSQNTSVIKST